ncbi:8722_t:CDS:2, partial [Gigaspora margarita]
RRNHLARESYARQRSLLIAEQLEHRHTQQREAYRLHTEAELSQQTKHQCKNRRAAYVRHTQQRHASNAACMQIYDTTTVERHYLGSMDVECSYCCTMHWIEEKVSVQLPTINQPPEPLLSLLTGED